MSFCAVFEPRGRKGQSWVDLLVPAYATQTRTQRFLDNLHVPGGVRTPCPACGWSDGDLDKQHKARLALEIS